MSISVSKDVQTVQNLQQTGHACHAHINVGKFQNETAITGMISHPHTS